jgi:hypothetical protein
VAGARALRTAYQTGRVNSGGGALGSVPIIDYRAYVDTKGDIHDRLRSFEMRARLIRANGHAGNQVILTNPRTGNVVLLMDEWLDRVARDQSSGSPAAKAVRNKPPGLVDACWSPEGEKIAEPATYDGPGRCNGFYPAHGDPRIAAGAPLSNDILKCSLKPLRPEDYRQPLSGEQIERLKVVFPHGVCDYSRPGVAQSGSPQPWRKY